MQVNDVVRSASIEVIAVRFQGTGIESCDGKDGFGAEERLILAAGRDARCVVKVGRNCSTGVVGKASHLRCIGSVAAGARQACQEGPPTRRAGALTVKEKVRGHATVSFGKP